MTDPTATPLAPLCRPLLPADVTAAGTRVAVKASPEECAALAEAADVVDVAALEAEFLVRPWSGHGFSVTGRVTARLTQSCVVTLEPIETRVDEMVDLRLVPPEHLAKYLETPDEKGEIDVDVLAPDLPEAIENGVIDLGAIATEHFMLGIDPYPRKPGAAFDAAAAGLGEAAPETTSPFAALARLKKE